MRLWLAVPDGEGVWKLPFALGGEKEAGKFRLMMWDLLLICMLRESWERFSLYRLLHLYTRYSKCL